MYINLLLSFFLFNNLTLNNFNNKKDIKDYQVIYQNLLQRIYINIIAVDTLFDKFNKNTYIKFPMAIIMRTCISDSIIVAYFASILDKQGTNNFKEQIIKLNHPFAREINEEIEEMIKYGDPKYKEYFELAASYLPGNFTKGRKIKLKKIQELEPKGMVKALKGTQLEWYSEIYKLYQYYSKYEHYGMVSKRLIEFNTEFEFDKIVFSSYYILQAAFMAMQFLDVGIEKIGKMEDLRDRIVDIEPTFDEQKSNN